jgi:hypothetical protein
MTKKKQSLQAKIINTIKTQLNQIKLPNDIDENKKVKVQKLKQLFFPVNSNIRGFNFSFFGNKPQESQPQQPQPQEQP